MIHAKLFAAALAALILVVSLCSCEIGTEPTETTEATTEAATVIPYDDRAGTMYVRQNARPDGTYGIDRFSITLYNDGTCQYYATLISSYIGMCRYEIDGDILTITDDGIPGLYGTLTNIYKFKIVGDTLVFLADGSDDFMYIKLPDGAVFEKE